MRIASFFSSFSGASPGARARALSILCALLAAGCADDSCDPDSTIYCADDDCTPVLFCDHSPPSQGRVNILISSPKPVWVRVYSGSAYETGTLIKQYHAPAWSQDDITVPFGDYSATALYVLAGDTVLAVDGDYTGYTASDTCEGTCYEEEDGELDLRLE